MSGKMPRMVPDGPAHVRLIREEDGTTCRIPATEALRVFLATHRLPVTQQSYVVALSVLSPDVPAGQPPPAYVWVGIDRGGDRDDTPDWLPPDLPCDVDCPEPIHAQPGVWYAVPHLTGRVDDLLERADRARCLREQDISGQIKERCAAVVTQGEDTGYTDTLDYYTTVRVKHAFQRLNAAGIQSRREEVRERMEHLTAACAAADPACVLTYEVPDDAVSIDEAGMDDPNAICVPHTEDYALPSFQPP